MKKLIIFIFLIFAVSFFAKPILAAGSNDLNQKLGDMGNDLKDQRNDREAERQDQITEENQQKFDKASDQRSADAIQNEAAVAEDAKNKQEMERQDGNDANKLTEGKSTKNKRECVDQQIRLGATSREAEDACR